jgi:shikimate kinase
MEWNTTAGGTMARTPTMFFSPSAPIFLIGYRGTGKTTVGRLLAARLDREAIDSDNEVEHRAGKSISAIFAEDGEAAFRALEAEVVAELCRRSRVVVAPGGGAVLRESTQAAMRTAGPVVWLTASIDTIAARLAADESKGICRPNLTPVGGRDEIEAVLAERTPIYRACATFVVDTEGKTPAEVANEIIANL